jgi:hypothetical protein
MVLFLLEQAFAQASSIKTIVRARSLQISQPNRPGPVDLDLKHLFIFSFFKALFKLISTHFDT